MANKLKMIRIQAQPETKIQPGPVKNPAEDLSEKIAALTMPQRERFEERAAIAEYEGNLSREEAEALALEEVSLKLIEPERERVQIYDFILENRGQKYKYRGTRDNALTCGSGYGVIIISQTEAGFIEV